MFGYKVWVVHRALSKKANPQLTKKSADWRPPDRSRTCVWWLYHDMYIAFTIWLMWPWWQPRRSRVSVVVADDLSSIWRQGICNHYEDVIIIRIAISLIQECPDAESTQLDNFRPHVHVCMPPRPSWHLGTVLSCVTTQTSPSIYIYIYNVSMHDDRSTTFPLQAIYPTYFCVKTCQFWNFRKLNTINYKGAYWW